MMSVIERRTATTAEARTWLTTPFVYGACLKGVGVDCGRFPAAVLKTAGGVVIDLNSLPRLAPRWFLNKQSDPVKQSPYLKAILTYTKEYALTSDHQPQPGDVVAVEFGYDVAHAALVLAWPSVIAAAFDACVLIWQDIYRSPQYAHRKLHFFDPFI